MSADSDHKVVSAKALDDVVRVHDAERPKTRDGLKLALYEEVLAIRADINKCSAVSLIPI